MIVSVPREALRINLAKVADRFRRTGTPYMLIGFLPGPGCVHIESDAPDASRANALRKLAQAIIEYADKLERERKPAASASLQI